MRLPLPSVTIVAVDTVCHDLLAISLASCLKQVAPAEVLVLSDRAVYPEDTGLSPAPRVRYKMIAPCSASMADVHLWYTVPPLLRTEHFLVIQWDSCIINPSAWVDDYLSYDYIGAPWGWHNDGMEVGNGGFSLRSSRLASHLAANPDKFPLHHPEDVALCRANRGALEAQGFRWAPMDLAYRFAFERTLPAGHHPEQQPFGFHGMFNWPHVYPPAEIKRRVALAPDFVLRHEHYRQMRELMSTEPAA